ncbi:MAG TPA: response regulator [Geopsychrobacteraceae bacterium]|nr:response regulator [Geopsychrobacteraceae bacterium]
MSKVLLVDDVELFLELEKSYLEECGYDLMTATSGEETLRRIDELAPDILLLDFYMPEINGDEVCKTLKKSERWKNLPIIMVTAAGQMEEIQQCLESGCDDYVTKPVDKLELQEKVKRLLGKIDHQTTERINIELPVTVLSEGGEYQAQTRDISQTGTYLQSAAPVAEGSPVDLRLIQPDGSELRLLGKVKRSNTDNKDGFGVYFIHPGVRELEALNSLISGGTKSLRNEGSMDMDAQQQRMKELEEECARLKAENEEITARVAALEQENQEFAGQFVQIEEVNNNLTNLYIASSRLHSTLDREEALAIIKEVVINFVGAEKFAILVNEEADGVLRYETGEGFEEDETFPDIVIGEGILGQTAENKEDYFVEGSISEGSDDLAHPLVAIPLVIHDEVLGVLAIYSLFVQKEQLDPIDYQLFSMLGEHAATSLFSSALYSKSERKRQTYQGFMDLLLK